MRAIFLPRARACSRRASAPRIRAATDAGTVPMAAAFTLVGYVTFERQIE